MYVIHWSCSKAESRRGWAHLDLLKHPLSWALLQPHEKSLDTPSWGHAPSDLIQVPLPDTITPRTKLPAYELWRDL